MKKIVFSLLACLYVTSAFGKSTEAQALQKQIDELKQQIAQLQEAKKAKDVTRKEVDAMKREITAVKKHDAKDNIKFSADFRTAYDIIDYKLANGDSHNNELWTNKLILGMAAQPLDNLIFKGALGVYKVYGNNNSAQMNPYQAMDWYGTNSPSNSTIKLREAYFLYFGEMGEFPYTVSFGRRPSVDGFLTNYREDNEHAASPTGHNINMEFDGASFKLDLEKATTLAGLYIKLCLGRGNSDAEARYPTFTNHPSRMGMVGMSDMLQASLPYGKSNFDSPNMDLAGIITQLYNDGQYKVLLNLFKAWNVMGANFNRVSDGGTNAIQVASMAMQKAIAAGASQKQAMNSAMKAFQTASMDDIYAVGMTDVGDMLGGSLGIEVSGIGDGWSDFLDDMIFFASFAWSKTDPKGTHITPMSQMMAEAAKLQGNSDATARTTEMLGSHDAELGTSYYIGINMPGFLENDRIGLEYNHGSKYWRSFTYGEDTLAGSKLATRGNAYEAYYNLPLLGKNLTAQLRYTYMDYDYTGSTMFFGSTGTPMKKAQAQAQNMPFIDHATDVRVSLRYRY